MDKKMETLHNLCHVLMEELEDYSKKIDKSDSMSAVDLEAVDKLSHALKSIKTTIAMMEADEDSGYSERYMPWGMSYADMGRGNYNRDGMSYARGRSYARGGRGNNPMGRNQYSRDDGYSYADDFKGVLKEALDSAPNEHVREKLQRIMSEV